MHGGCHASSRARRGLGPLADARGYITKCSQSSVMSRGNGRPHYHAAMASVITNRVLAPQVSEGTNHFASGGATTTGPQQYCVCYQYVTAESCHSSRESANISEANVIPLASR